MIERSQVLDYLVKAPMGTINNQAMGIDFHEDNFSFEELLNRYKRDVIKKALAECNHNKAKAAQLLKMDRSTLRYQMKMLDLV
jgi:DNA-binding NtrC family response regulator